MCTKYKVCGERHKAKWQVSRKRRNHKGQFVQPRRTLTAIFLGIVFVGAGFTIGWNTILRSVGMALQVDNSHAEVKWHQPTLREEVTMMLEKAEVDVETALKIADYESWFKEDNFHVNTKGQYAGTIDRGLWMLSDYFYADVSDECAYDGICSTIHAIRIMKTRGFNEWTCYKQHLCR